MNIHEVLEQATALQKIAEKRAEELLMANGCKYDVRLDGFEFETDSITVHFREITRDSYEETDGVTLSIDQLLMSDTDWNVFIEGKNNERFEKIKKEKLKKELEIKNKKFLELKKELGL